MNSRWRPPTGWAGLFAAGAGLAGVVGGFAVERYAVGRARRAPDPEAREPFGALHGRGRSVLADDGVPLHVEEVGDPNAPLHVVFVHGFTLSMDCWHYQRRDLADVGHLVFYDARSHGRSGRGSAESATLDQLGRDLYRVLQATVPAGSVVLVGHSMGGMTVMALADQRPELFGPRVVGVALLSTAAGLVGETLLGVPAVAGGVLRAVAPTLANQVNHRAALIERGRRAGSDLSFVVTRWASFGPRVPPSLVGFMERMVAGTPIEVMSEFFPTFTSHDKLAALPVLDAVPTLVLCGERDVLTPPRHSRRIAEALPRAELVLLADAGHMIPLERAALVNLHLRALFRRAVRARGRRSA